MARDKNKDFNYFDYFCNISDMICEAADCLDKALKSFDRNDFRTRMDAMHDIENRADSARHDMTKRLMHEFLPPIDREDILELSAKLDDIVDALDDTMRRIYMYNVNTVRVGALSFSGLITRCAAALKETTAEFRAFKTSKLIREKLVEVNTLESEGDSLHSDLLHTLYSEEGNTRDLLVWTNIYEDLESCLDNCEDAADIIESVIMKNT